MGFRCCRGRGDRGFRFRSGWGHWSSRSWSGKLFGKGFFNLRRHWGRSLHLGGNMLGDERFLLVLLTDQDGQDEAENEESGTEVDGGFLKHAGGAGTEDLIRHASTECRAKTLLLRTLHQNDQGHQNADEDEDHEQQVDANVKVVDRSESHGRGTMGAVPELVKRGFFGISGGFSSLLSSAGWGMAPLR